MRMKNAAPSSAAGGKSDWDRGLSAAGRSECDLQDHLAVAAFDADVDDVAGLGLLEKRRKILGILERLSVP